MNELPLAWPDVSSAWFHTWFCGPSLWTALYREVRLGSKTYPVILVFLEQFIIILFCLKIGLKVNEEIQPTFLDICDVKKNYLLK